MGDFRLAACGSVGSQPGTTYLNLLGALRTFSSTEAHTKLRVHNTGFTLKNLFMRLTANSATTAHTVRSRKNGADGTMSISIASGATGVFEDTTNSDSLTTNDDFNVSFVEGNASCTATMLGAVLSNASDIHILGKAVQAVTPGAGATTYALIDGAGDTGTNEANKRYVFRSATTLSKLRVYVSTISDQTIGADVIRTRKNGANGGQSVSITGTGFTEDASGSDSIAAGDDCNYQIIEGGVGITLMIWQSIQVKSASAGRQMMGLGTDFDLASGLTRYLYEGQRTPVATEANQTITMRGTGDIKNMFIRAPTNSLTGGSGSTATLRLNSAASALTVSIANGSTGNFEDTTNSVAIVATDTLSYQFISGGTSGSINLRMYGVEHAVGAAAAALVGKAYQARQAVGRAALW